MQFSRLSSLTPPPSFYLRPGQDVSCRPAGLGLTLEVRLYAILTTIVSYPFPPVPFMSRARRLLSAGRSHVLLPAILPHLKRTILPLPPRSIYVQGETSPVGRPVSRPSSLSPTDDEMPFLFAARSKTADQKRAAAARVSSPSQTDDEMPSRFAPKKKIANQKRAAAARVSSPSQTDDEMPSLFAAQKKTEDQKRTAGARGLPPAGIGAAGGWIRVCCPIGYNKINRLLPAGIGAAWGGIRV